MKTYSLASVPTCAGIYYLTNKLTGEVYVGQSLSLRRRHAEWKNALGSGFGHTNAEMYEAMQRNPDIDEWFFVVTKELPGSSTPELLAAEAEEIARLRVTLQGKLLNSDALKNTPVPVSDEGRVIIKTKLGGIIGQAAAAQLLGRNITTLQDKVRWLRQQGVMEVELEDLTMDRRKILEKYKGG